MNLLLANAQIFDGTGAPPQHGAVLINDGLVRELGTEVPAPADAVRVDVGGAAIAPGFVDIHTHSDLSLLSSPHAFSKVHQGVTTEVVGNCGLGLAPVTAAADRDGIRSAVSYLDLDPSIEWDWTDIAGYHQRLRSAAPSLNVAALVAHLPLHAAVAGFGDEAPTRSQLDIMCGLLADAFDAGAVGLSTGLAYAPLTTVADEELLELGSVCQRHDRVFAWHMADYGRGLGAAVDQVLKIAAQTGCRVQISHLQAVGRRNWPQVELVLDKVSQARDRGLQVGVDIYPYLHGNAPMCQRLPAWAQQGSAREWAPRLRDREVRNRVRQAWSELDVGWDETTVSWIPSPDDQAIGKPVSELAEQTAQAPEDWALDALANHGTGVMMVVGGRSDDALRSVLAHPATVVASDGIAMDPAGPTSGGSPHPRSFGCFPRYLGRYTDPDRTDFAEAIARCTSRPAALLGLDRGTLAPEKPADIVVFSPEHIIDQATFTEPRRFPAGISLVIVNGQIVVDDGRHTGARPGHIISAR